MIFVAWRDGTPRIRFALSTAILSGWMALSIVIIGDAGILEQDLANAIGGILGAIVGGTIFIILAYQSAVDQRKSEQKVEEAERRAEEQPQQPRAAWDLARIKLEQYLDRNLKQVRSIFWLSILVMGVGFTLIGYGVLKVYENPATFNASIVTAISGILINFIGATFLIIYRSTMEQAKDYVSILERINAVGMSVQILEQIDETDPKLKNQATADVAKQLLALYQQGGSQQQSRRGR